MDRKKKASAFSEKWKAFWAKAQVIWGKIKHVLGIIWKVLFHMRKLFLSIPVIWGAVETYGYAKEHLPETVGVLMRETGKYVYLVDRNVALMSSLALTAACLLLMLCSRRTIYPWLISMFTLVVPFLLVITNIFPA